MFRSLACFISDRLPACVLGDDVRLFLTYLFPVDWVRVVPLGEGWERHETWRGLTLRYHFDLSPYTGYGVNPGPMVQTEHEITVPLPDGSVSRSVVVLDTPIASIHMPDDVPTVCDRRGRLI